VDSGNPTNNCERIRTLTYTATDNCGNSNTCTQVITWTVPDSAPVLSVVLQGSNIVVSWPLTCAAFALEQTPGLNTVNWTPVSQPVVVDNDRNTVTIPVSSMAFYRLRCCGP
jgi:hypothetical protein